MENHERPAGVQARPDGPTPASIAAALFVNTRSRRGARLYRQAKTLLREAGVELGLAAAVRDPRELPHRVAAAIAGGYTRILVGGGDGTLRSTMASFANQPITLGVLPLGTGNNLACTVGIPLDLAGAVAVIAGGHTARIDLGVANGHYFINTVSIGLSTVVAREVPDWLKRHLGVPAYVIAAAKTLGGHRAFRARLIAPQRDLRIATHQVMVANGACFGARLRVGADAAIDNGELIVFTFEGESRAHLVRRTLGLVLGRHAADPGTHYFATTALTLDADPAQPINADGEVIGATPLTIGQAPRALRLFVPPDFRESPAPAAGAPTAI